MAFQSCSFFTTIILNDKTAGEQTSEAETTLGPLILEFHRGVL